MRPRLAPGRPRDVVAPAAALALVALVECELPYIPPPTSIGPATTPV